MLCGDAVVDGPNDGGGPSLQDRFQQMRNRRLAAEARLKAAEAARAAGGRSPESKRQLRERFVEQVKSYIGTPYSSVRNPELAGSNPLFLDCCGLVRRALLDLKEDFGFEVGPWAQEYLFDTLPTSVEPHELVPGDLVFWKAEPNDPERKRHKHDLVHVEVFIGGGGGSYPVEGGASSERTCGSRYEGVEVPGVGVFESYRSFGGHGNHGHELFFRSIDTWLDGICVNHCPQCSWAEPGPVVGARRKAKSTLFAQQQQQQLGEIENKDKQEGHSEQVVVVAPA